MISILRFLLKSSIGAALRLVAIERERTKSPSFTFLKREGDLDICAFFNQERRLFSWLDACGRIGWMELMGKAWWVHFGIPLGIGRRTALTSEYDIWTKSTYTKSLGIG